METGLYDKELREFAELTERAMMYSRYTAGTMTKERRIAVGSALFVSVVLRARSLLRLIPGSDLHPRDHTAQLDPGSIAAVARAFTEACQVFYYLGAHEVPAEQWEARHLSARLHETIERRAMFRRLGDRTDDDAMSAQIDDLKARLLRNSYFANLTEKTRQKCLESGLSMIGTTQVDVGTVFLGDRDVVRFTHKWLSSYTHQHPFAFFSISEDRGRGVDNDSEHNLIRVMLNTCVDYLKPACAMYESMFPQLETATEDAISDIVSRRRDKPSQPTEP